MPGDGCCVATPFLMMVAMHPNHEWLLLMIAAVQPYTECFRVDVQLHSDLLRMAAVQPNIECLKTEPHPELLMMSAVQLTLNS